MSKQAKILVSGYTYTDPNCLKTFDFYPDPDNIFFIIPKRWPIKGGRYVFLPRKGHNVKVAKAFFPHSNYPVIGGILKGWMPAFPIHLFRIRPDIVFSACELNLLTTLYEGIFTKLSGAKHFTFTWENIPHNVKFKGLRGYIQKTIVRLNLYFSDGLICGSVKSQAIMKKITNKPIALIQQVGFDSDFFTRDYSQKKFRDQDMNSFMVFSFVGAIDFRKGIHLVVKAFENIFRLVPNARLIIAGNGSYEKEIEELINKCESRKQIRKLSWLNRDEVRELLNCSDVFIYPSISYGGWEEQLGFSLAEASSMELPIISTKSGSISEMVIDGETGILVEPNNIEALGKAMIALADKEQFRIQMGKNGREFVRNNYSYQVVAKKFYNLFN